MEDYKSERFEEWTKRALSELLSNGHERVKNTLEDASSSKELNGKRSKMEGDIREYVDKKINWLHEEQQSSIKNLNSKLDRLAEMISDMQQEKPKQRKFSIFNNNS